MKATHFTTVPLYFNLAGMVSVCTIPALSLYESRLNSGKF